MYDGKRAATVTCTAAGTIHVLTRDVRRRRYAAAATWCCTPAPCSGAQRTDV
jgi:hypothetical protein